MVLNAESPNERSKMRQLALVDNQNNIDPADRVAAGAPTAMIFIQKAVQGNRKMYRECIGKFLRHTKGQNHIDNVKVTSWNDLCSAVCRDCHFFSPFMLVSKNRLSYIILFYMMLSYFTMTNIRCKKTVDKSC